MRQQDHLALIWLRLGIFHLIQYKLTYCQGHIRLYGFPQDVELPKAFMESEIIILENAEFPPLERSLLALPFDFLSKVAKSIPITTSQFPLVLICAQLSRELWVVNQGITSDGFLWFCGFSFRNRPFWWFDSSDCGLQFLHGHLTSRISENGPLTFIPSGLSIVCECIILCIEYLSNQNP